MKWGINSSFIFGNSKVKLLQLSIPRLFKEFIKYLFLKDNTQELLDFFSFIEQECPIKFLNFSKCSLSFIDNPISNSLVLPI